MASADGSGQIYQDRLNERLLTLTRVEAGMTGRVLGLLRNIEREIVRQLAATDLTEFAEQRLRGLLGNVQGLIRTGYSSIGRDLNERLGRLAGIESAWALATLNAAVHTSLLSTAVPVEQALATARDTLYQGAPLSEWLGRQAAGLQDRFGDQVRLGVSLGETNQQIMNRVRGTRAAGYQDGIFETSRREAQALVRTAAQTIANNAHEELFQANTDLVTGQVWVSTLDSRTSPQCIARDGLVWDMEGKPVGHSVKFRRPPIHWNCRSVLTPKIASWQDLGIDADELSESTRASMDGQVPASTTYETWLRSKPVAFQDDVLGVGKAKLWRAGKIGLRELINNSGRPLDLSELERMLG
jgi:SPP1 gp7 family putative phage head morphogenesis protein